MKMGGNQKQRYFLDPRMSRIRRDNNVLLTVGILQLDDILILFHFAVSYL